VKFSVLTVGEKLEMLLLMIWWWCFRLYEFSWHWEMRCRMCWRRQKMSLELLSPKVNLVTPICCFFPEDLIFIVTFCTLFVFVF